MMDISLFLNRNYALAIGTICSAFFAVYGMLLLTTQYLQNVRGYSAETTGLVILPFSAAIALLSPLVGRLVGRYGARVLVLSGLATMIVGMLALVAGGHGNLAVVLVGLALCGIGSALCLTPITAIAMTSVPPQRAGMASGIMSAQRAIGSTVGFAVMGSVLAAWLSATLDRDLVPALPDAVERRAVAAAIVSSANPRTQVAEMVPRRPIAHPDRATQVAITKAAEQDFVQGIRLALLVAVAALLAALLAGWRWFPRDPEAPQDARREESSGRMAEATPPG
jgi:MFS family permease